MINLKTYSEYSSFGYLTVQEIIRISKTNNDAISIVDYKNISFFPSMIDQKQQYIVGCEIMVFDKTYKINGHITFMVTNNTGFNNLITLINISEEQGFLSLSNIENSHTGLVLYSGGKHSLSPGIFRRHIDYIYSLFSDRKIEIFFEIQRHTDKACHESYNLIKHCRMITNNKIIFTDPVLFLDKEDFRLFKIKQYVQNSSIEYRSKINVYKNCFRKPIERLRKIFRDIPCVFDNVKDLINRCFFKYKISYNLPRFGRADNYRALVKESFSSRRLPRHVLYTKRLIKELKIVKRSRFASVFLIVQDVVRWARQEGIVMGPGRGSCASSLISYLIGVSEVDPIKNNLIFERFLNKDKISLPDFDIDFCHDKRSDVIDYLEKKYSTERVLSVVTFGTFSMKNTIRDVGRVLGFRYREINNLVNSDKKQSKKKYKIVFDIANKLNGRIKNKGVHAGGIIILSKNCSIPYYRLGGVTASQFDKKNIERIRILKIDILGLKTLSIVRRVKGMVQIPLYESVDLKDKKVYRFLTNDQNTGIFQLEGYHINKIIKRIRPIVFSDLVSVISINRPGPIKFLNEYIESKYACEISKETRGLLLFQEQITMLINKYFMYNINQSEIIRREVDRKKLNELDKFLNSLNVRERYIKRRNKILNTIRKFSGYTFNKAHAFSYGVLTFYTTFIKAKYFIQYATAVINTYVDDKEKIRHTQSECYRNNIYFAKPNINKAQYEFSITEKRYIMVGFSCIKYISRSDADHIIDNRKGVGYRSFFDFFLKVNKSIINKKKIECLIYAGCFKETKEELIYFIKNNLYKCINRQNSLLSDIRYKKKYYVSYRKEMNVLGIYIENPISKLASRLEQFVKKCKLITYMIGLVVEKLRYTTVIQDKNLKEYRLMGHYNHIKIMDIVVFDRMTRKLFTYNEDNQ
ncbi:DNA polymerase III subunit alpha [Candidatus Vidania fulgoroideorum]